MKLLTFLGVGRYDETEYNWNGQSVLGRFAPMASSKFSNADQVIVFATQEAELAHGQAFRSALNLPVHFVPVPKGENEDELWQVFSKVAENVVPGEEVAFDVTHGLRSFPLVGILAAAFLRTGLRVSLKAVYYGAFDVRDQSVSPNRTPMFDLTPMLTLLEWAIASDRFSRTGDGRYFASLLREQQKKLALKSRKKSDQLTQVGNIGKLASALTDISQSLSLIRPQLAMRQIERLPTQVQAALPMLAQASATLPFQMMLNATLQSFEQLSLSDPSSDLRQDLLTQRAMIRWYADHEHWMQAVSLAREWLVSWVMLQFGLTSLTVLADRHRIEGVVNSEAEEFVKIKQQHMTYQPVFLKTLPQVETVLGLWKSLTNTRNDIDHAAMRENPQEPDTLVKQIQGYIRALEDLPL
jgi:CRISPR-associated DxTHG motif protein